MRLEGLDQFSAAGRTRSNEKFSDIWNRTSDLPACNIMPQSTTLRRAPFYLTGITKYVNNICNNNFVTTANVIYVI
jgi:hypothetical protein